MDCRAAASSTEGPVSVAVDDNPFAVWSTVSDMAHRIIIHMERRCKLVAIDDHDPVGDHS